MQRFHGITHTRVTLYKDTSVVELPVDDIFLLAKLVSTLNIDRKKGTVENLMLDIGSTLASASANDFFLILSTNNKIFKSLKERKNFLFLSPELLERIRTFEQTRLIKETQDER
jgi:hypothetical protein